MSLALHALLFGLALLAGFGINAGGGAGAGFGSENSLFLAGSIRLQASAKAGQDSASFVAGQRPGAAAPVRALTHGQEQNVVAREKPLPAAPDAIPVPTEQKPEKKNRPQKRPEAKKPATAGKEQTAKDRLRPGEAADATDASGGVNHGASAPAGNGHSQAASGSHGGGSGNAGENSGMKAGATGNARGTGNQKTGFGGQVDSKPRVVNRSRVRYPDFARKNKITGHVLLRFHLDAQGTMSELQVLTAEPPGIFEEAALAAVRQWRFAPALKDGRPVPYWVELPMPFILK